MNRLPELEPGTIVTPADPAAFPGIVGEVDDVDYVYHVATGEVVAVYYYVLWVGEGRKPDEYQVHSAVKPIERDDRGAHFFPVALF